MDIQNYFKTNKLETRSATYSVSDPALAEWLGIANRSSAGINVNETSALGLTAVYRSVSMIAGTIASLPLKTYRTLADDTRDRTDSFLDAPCPGMTPFEWKELTMVHLLLHGNAYLFHIYNGAGALIGLQPIHPRAVSVEKTEFGKVFTVTTTSGQRKYSNSDVTQIMAMSLDGVYGLSPIQAARNAIGTGIAGDNAAANMFANGMLLGGVVSAEGITEEQAAQVKAGLKNNLSGSGNAGDIAVINAELKFSPWTMNAEDAQFIESRAHQVEEVARIFGLPKTMLAQDGASTWGSGIAELIRGFQRFTLMPWTKRYEENLSVLLPKSKYVEFDYAGLLAPSPKESIENMKMEIEAGLLTIDEGRRLLNRPPAPKQEPTQEKTNNVAS